MDKQAIFKQYYLQLENVKEDIGPADFRFYNLAHLPLIIKNTLEKSENCEECKVNITTIDKIIISLPEALQSHEERKKFELNKTKIEQHLKKIHKMRFPGYYASLGSLIGILLGIFIGIIFSSIRNLPLLNDFILITLALGLIIGRGVGLLLDRNIFNKNLQL
jgi:tetrahydromethanopterin S-methyltransferase subunit G